MKQIDFLPQRYRDQHVRRKAGTWRLLVCALFGGAIVVASVGQFWHRRQVQSRLVEIQPLLAESQALNDRLVQMQGELTQLTQRANVCALLQNRWRRTQIVSLVVKPLPDSIRVEELDIVERTIAPTNNGPRFNSEASDSAEQLPPAARDAADLEKRLRDDQTVATLKGITADVAALHVYLEALERQPLVARVELLSVDNVKTGETKGQQQFVAEVLIESPLNALGTDSKWEGEAPAEPPSVSEARLRRSVALPSDGAISDYTLAEHTP